MAVCCKPNPLDVVLCALGVNSACTKAHFAEVACGILCDVFPMWMPDLLVTPPPPDPPWWEILDRFSIDILNQGFTPADPQQLRKVKLEALTEFRKGFEEVIMRLDQEIQSIA